tara:strand:+ start:300 stop:2012 length:1713 start_codon:yes stop_codon:yes gene_type:complete
MKIENTRLKLDDPNSTNKLDKVKKQSRNLKLTDRAIKTLDTAFIVSTGNNTSKTLTEVSYKFEECKGRLCQGLRLIHQRTKQRDRKKLVLDYWFGGKAKRHYLPDYDPNNFNVRHIHKRIADLRDLYGNPRNYTWDKDINLEEKRAKLDKFKASLRDTSVKTFKEIIEEMYVAGFPKIRNDGTSPSRYTIRNMTRYILGIKDRSRSFRLDEDTLHNGVMVLKPGFATWGDVFKKYPSAFNPEDYPEKDIKFKPGVPIYDGPLSIMHVHELTTDLVSKYLATTDKPSMKIELKGALSYLWGFALNKGYLPGTPNNPFTAIKISKPRKTHMTDWNKKEFTQEQQISIYNVCNELKPQFPGQPELFQLALRTGRRIQTLLKLKWNDIKFKDTLETYTDDNGKDKVIKYFGIISIKPWSNKTDDEDNIPITQSIKSILDSLADVRDRQEPWRRFIDWVFVSPRVKDKEFLRIDNPNNSAKARLKDPRYCWKALLKKTGLEKDAMQKMFRTTFQNKVDRLKGVNSSWDAITITGQNDTRAHEKHYLNKKLTPKVIHHYQQIDDEFEEPFKTRNDN